VRYTFPGRYASSSDAQRKVGVRLAAHQLQAQIGHGKSFCYNLTAGTTFTLSGHPDSAFNVQYVARSVTHRASQDTYENSFEVFPFSVPFRAPLTTPLPVVAGTHTANVVGSSGEEIWTDAYGRIKIKFHWDRSPGRNQNSSGWVRVAQAWAGSGWGHWVLPRIGQEVIVSYVEGDPDRPLVTGSVYNLQSSVPVALPGSQTQSVMRSRSSKGGTAGNEIRMEDLLNSEQLYIFAQKDMNVSVTNGLTTTVVGADETHTVQKGNRTVAVQTGNETHTVQGTRSLTVTGNETHTNSAAFTQSVSGNHTHTVSGNHAQTVSGDYTLTVSGNCTLNVTGNFVIAATGSVSIKSDQGVTSQAGTSHTVAAGTSLSLQGMSISEQASMSHSIDGGASLQLTGGVVEINS
jgi:type VI secretion system secreted protein VgrG